MRFSVDKRTGFEGINPEIYDKRGLFYSKNGNVKFNLPAGNYYTKFRIEKLPEPVKFKIPKLPRPERRFKLRFPKIELEFGLENKYGTPAVCIPEKGRIIFDENYYFNLSSPEFWAIYLHECGHFLYSTEKYCDLFAGRQMVKMGFNPSQCALAFVDNLKPRNYLRKEFIVNKLGNGNSSK